MGYSRDTAQTIRGHRRRNVDWGETLGLVVFEQGGVGRDNQNREGARLVRATSIAGLSDGDLFV
jgi:hypothetical protein